MLLSVESDQRVCRRRFHQRTDGRYLRWWQPPYLKAGMRIGDYNATETGRGSSPRRLERRLAAILGADVMSYSALMERNEEETHERVGAELERFRHEIEKSDGRVFALAG